MADHFDDEDDATDSGAEEREITALPTNERDYLIPATDAKGHAARVQCRIPPSEMRLLVDVFQKRKFPFRVQGDLIRFVIVRGVRQLAQAAGINSTAKHSDAIIEMMRDELQQLEFDEALSITKLTIDRYLERRAYHKARELLARVRRQISAMPDGYWKAEYENEIQTRWGTLLDGDVQPEPGIGAFANLQASDVPELGHYDEGDLDGPNHADEGDDPWPALAHTSSDDAE